MRWFGTTAYAAAPRWLAWLLIAVALLLVATSSQIGKPPLHKVFKFSDEALYVAVVSDIEHGRGYYEAAAAEHRLHGYPISPPVVFREPWLAWMLATLHNLLLAQAVLVLLALSTLMVAARDFIRAGLHPIAVGVLTSVASTGFLILASPSMVYHHEIWAGVLLAASLVFYRRDRWLPSVLLGFLACLMRELVVPYLAIMGLLAAYERRYREAAHWAAAIALFAMLFALHLHEAAQLYRPGDAVSRAWVVFGGFSFITATARFNVLVLALPRYLSVPAVYLAVIGLLGWRDVRARAAGILVSLYVLVFAIAGRPDNTYWGLLYAPLLGFGLALALPAGIDLVTRAVSIPTPSEGRSPAAP